MVLLASGLRLWPALPQVRAVVPWTLAAAAVAALRWRPTRGGLVLQALALVACSLTITTLALAEVPKEVNRATVWACHLRPFILVAHAGAVAAVVAALSGRITMAEAGFMATVVHTALNGRFCSVVDSRMSAVWGLILVTAASWLGEGIPLLLLPHRLALAFMAWVGVATARSIFVHGSVEVTGRLWAWGALALLASWIPRTSHQLRRMTGAVLASWILVACGSLPGLFTYASAMGWPTALRARLGLGLMHANGLAAVMATAVILGVGLVSVRALPTRALPLLLLPLGTLALTYSRSGAMGAAVGAAVLSRLASRDRGVVRRAAVAILASMLVLTIASTALRRGQGEWATRLTIWKLTLQVVRHHLTTGIGPGNHLPPAYASLFPRPYLPREDPVPLRDFFSSVRTAGWHPHNLFLELAEATGIVGVVLFVLLLVVTWKAAARGQAAEVGRVLAACLASLVASQLLESCIAAGTLLPVELMVVMGLMWAATSPQTPPPPRVPPPGAGAVVLGAVGLFCLGPALVETFTSTSRTSGKTTQESPRWLEVLAPWDPGPHVAHALLSQGSRAVAHWSEAVALRPWYGPWRQQLGWALWATGDTAAAAKEFRMASWLDPLGLDGNSPWVPEGLLALSQGRRPEALSLLSHAALVDPSSLSPPDWCEGPHGPGVADAYAPGESPERLRCYIELHLRAEGFGCEGSCGSLVTLDDVIQAMLASHADTIGRRYALICAVRLAELWARHPLALDLLAQLQGIVSSPLADARVKAKRSKALASLGRYQEAVEQAIASVHSFDHPVFRHRLGTLYLRKHQYQKAIPELERAARSWNPALYFDPEWPRYWLDLGEAYLQAGMPRQALRALLTARFLGLDLQAFSSKATAVALHPQADPSLSTRALREALQALSWAWPLPSPQPLEQLASAVVSSPAFSGLSPQEVFRAVRAHRLPAPARPLFLQALYRPAHPPGPG